MIPTCIRAPGLLFPQRPLMHRGAVLFSGAQFGECSRVMAVFVGIFSLSLPFLHAALKPTLRGLWVARGHAGGPLEFESGFLRYRAASASRSPGSLICSGVSWLRFCSGELGERDGVSPISSPCCQASSGPPASRWHRRFSTMKRKCHDGHG